MGRTTHSIRRSGRLILLHYFMFRNNIKEWRSKLGSKIGSREQSFKAIKIIPNNLEQCKAEDKALVLEYYNEDLTRPLTFQ